MRKTRIKILYEDKSIIVVSKPSNLLTISTDKEKEKTMYHQVLEYEKKKNKNNRIFIVHRLDKETSGIIVFAKNKEVKDKLQENWDDVKRYYVAIVEGTFKEKNGECKSYLIEDKNHIVHITNEKNGKFAHTRYSIINENKKYSLVDIQILTGRKNQIRVHMKELNHPILGDKKYGKSMNSVKKMYLHAYKIVFKHPITKKLVKIKEEIPEDFLNSFKNFGNNKTRKI